MKLVFGSSTTIGGLEFGDHRIDQRIVNVPFPYIPQCTGASRGRRAADAMISAFESLGPNSTIDDAADLILRTTQQEFPVVDETNKLLGVVTREAIVTALAQSGGDTAVSAIMTNNLPIDGTNAPLETVLKPLQQQGAVAVGLTDDHGKFVGYITPENIAEFLMIGRARDPHNAQTKP